MLPIISKLPLIDKVIDRDAEDEHRRFININILASVSPEKNSNKSQSPEGLIN